MWEAFKALPWRNLPEPFQARWTVVNPDFSLGWGTAPVGSTTDAHSAIFRGFGYVTTGQVDDLISPSYLLDSASTLIYDLAYRPLTGGASDTLTIYISTDCGGTWTALRQYVETGSNTFATGSSIANAFVPSSASDWRTDSLDLSAYTGQVRLSSK